MIAWRVIARVAVRSEAGRDPDVLASMPMLRRPDLSPKWGRCNAVETVWQRLGNLHLSTASNVIDSIGLPSHHLNTLMGLTCCQPISHIAMLLRASDVGVFAS